MLIITLLLGFTNKPSTRRRHHQTIPKCELPAFQQTCDRAHEPTYFHLRRFCQTPSPVSS
jgi:hypothetical protein